MTPKAPEEAPVPKAAVQKAGVAPVTTDQMKADFSVDLEKAKQGPLQCKGSYGRCRKQDVHVLLELAFSGEQVRVEQDRQRADGKRPLRQPSR